MTMPFFKLDASADGGASGHNAINLITGSTWRMKGGISNGCEHSTYLNVPVFDLENRKCYLETSERLPYCESGVNGYSTATWLKFRTADFGAFPTHRALAPPFLVLPTSHA